MKTLRSLLVVAGLSLAALTLTTGCSGTAKKTPARISHTVAATTIQTGDQAIDAWGDYVFFEKIRIEGLRLAAEKLPPGEERDNALGKMMDAKASLLNKESRVAAAYEKYALAATEAVKAGAASADLSGHIAGQIAAVSAPLIALVNELLRSN